MAGRLFEELFLTDPEFMERFDSFTFDEVIDKPELPGKELDSKTRSVALLAALMGSQSIDWFREVLPIAMEHGVSPVEIKEIVYQATPYLGFGRVYPFLIAVNEEFLLKKISMPLPRQANANADDRLFRGIGAQIDIFGEEMKTFYKSGPAETVHINKWLAANCFGDYYTRNGLDYSQREMITFCFLFSQGGCETQLKSHIQGNLNVGNDKYFLIKVVSQCIPYIGYPRCLNAVNCIQEVTK